MLASQYRVMVAWNTELPAFVLDLLSFIEEQIGQALTVPGDQYAAVDAARGVIPLFRERLVGNDHHLAIKIMLAFSDYYEPPHWAERWECLAKEPAERFRESAETLLAKLADLKDECRSHM